MNIVTLICLSVLASLPNEATNRTEFPVPPYSKKSLFYIHRSPNTNTVIYEVNLTEIKPLTLKIR